ncbi:MAG: peptidylprolyl isomerase [Nanoarchaeota archaeon]|nr:peptidylprolyl isomerase [Nanoarchaeota archaeon]
MIAEKGSKVKLDYEGRFEDGEVFDSSKHGDHSHPIEFEVGAGQVIPGFDNAVIGMKEGDEKEFSIKPQEAYGEQNPELIKKFPREALPQGQNPEKGMTVLLATPTGQQIPAKIAEVDEKEVTIDLNHPLAGKTLIFKIKVVSIA